MNVVRRAKMGLVATALVGVMAVSLACGSSAAEDPTPIVKQPITPAAPRTVVATASAATTPDAAETPGADGARLTLVAKNIKFDTKELSAIAGAITFIVDNEDTGVPHNIHIYKGTDAKGESMGKSDLKNGPSNDEVTLTLDAGAYFFVCDAHPNMKGKLTVE